jgi:ribokinase
MTSVVVFGSINMDVVTACERHPRLGETVIGNSVAFHPGGKGANQAIAAARCAGRSFLFGGVGDDDFGRRMLAYLQANDVDTSGVVIETSGSTGVAIITVDAQGDNTIVVTPGANALAKAPRHLPDTLSGAVIALAQLESAMEEITGIFAKVKVNGGTTILNPSPYQPLPPELLQSTSIIIMNEHEFAQLTGRPTINEPQELVGYLKSADLPLPCCIITLGAGGFILAEQSRAPIRWDGHYVEVRDTTGAGDCFAGWFAAELAAGRDLEDAARRANAAAAISVTRAGAGPSMPSKAEVENLLRRNAGPQLGMIIRQ